LSALRISEPVTSNRFSWATLLPDGPVTSVSEAGVVGVAIGAVTTDVLVVAAAEDGPSEAAGWLCADAGTANAADNAKFAQMIFLTASANVLCFISPSYQTSSRLAQAACPY
jgi:hypothetical protein